LSRGRFEDHTFEWQKAYEYRIAVVTLAGVENAVVVEAKTRRIKRFSPNDVYPPGVPTGLEAVFSGPGQAPFVDLLWPRAPMPTWPGITYRREDRGQVGKINAELVKTPAYP